MVIKKPIKSIYKIIILIVILAVVWTIRLIWSDAPRQSRYMAKAERQVEPIRKILLASERFQDVRIHVLTVDLGRMITIDGTVSNHEDLKYLDKIIEGRFSKEYQVFNRVSVGTSETKP
jgi:hypothetical protein